MENVFQADPPFRDPLDLDRPSDREMVGGNPPLYSLGTYRQTSGKFGLIAEMDDQILNGNRDGIHEKNNTTKC